MVRLRSSPHAAAAAAATTTAAAAAPFPPKKSKQTGNAIYFWLDCAFVPPHVQSPAYWKQFAAAAAFAVGVDGVLIVAGADSAAAIAAVAGDAACVALLDSVLGKARHILACFLLFFLLVCVCVSLFILETSVLT